MSEERANVRLQNLRDFTVQIHRLTSDKIVGTGVVVSTKGEIVTCAHVARLAGVEPCEANGKEIGVYFPQARGGEEKKRCATVVGCFPVHDDDVVLLQLAGGPPPLGPEQIAILGTASPSRDHTFQSYGYSSIGAYPALYAVGRIIGPIERPSDRLLQADPIQLQARQLDRGMSGAAVLDEERNLVVGIVAERVFPTTAVKDDVGYALTLGLLGGYLAEQHGGDVARIGEIPPPTADEPHYERVHRVLRRYDDHLTEAERAFLTLFSAFRTPVHESAFEKVFRDFVGAHRDAPLHALVQRLVSYRILRHDLRARTYTAHPLIRSHYFARLTASSREETQDAHARIKEYYLELAGDTPRFPTLDDLAPLIEVVHHTCRAGAYDEAWRVYLERIIQRDRKVLIHQLGAYETTLALTLEFFPGGDTSQEPQVSDPRDKSFILNRVGFCLMNLGRLGEAAPFYERGNAMNAELEDWHQASLTYQNLAQLHAYLGVLTESADAAREALELARRAENKQDEMLSLAYQAWAAHLRGDLETAGMAFQQAEALEREIDPDVRYLYSPRGIKHADHLRRAGDADYARRVTEANLEICERNRWPDDLSLSHRVLGDLDADAGDHESARAHYDQALKIARSITRRDVLIEALLARGRWAARYQDLTGFQRMQFIRNLSGLAFSDLNEALGYAVDGGYRIYEADVRVALAWAHLAAALTPGPSPRGRGEALAAARQEAERAQQMSIQMGYHWGQVDAAEVLEELNH